MRERTLWQRISDPPIPRRLARNFRRLDEAGVAELTASLKSNYFAGFPDGHLSTAAGQRDLHDHLFGRMEHDRRRVVPWFDAARPLLGARVLEIGCGTGGSTVVLAEQGAVVTAVDVDERSLRDARTRCRLHGLDVTFLHENATSVGAALAGRTFDFVLFYASLEHMTHAERRTAMDVTWRLLPRGGLWCVIECPNRLWDFDAHTSQLPFFFWLPREVAIPYARFSPRAEFREAFADAAADEAGDAAVRFARWGRGVSYHEFDLVFGRAETLDVVSSLPSFVRARNPAAWFRWRLSRRARLESFLRARRPDLHRGFFEEQLNLIVRR